MADSGCVAGDHCIMRAGDSSINFFVIGGAFGVAFVVFELVAAALTFAVVANVAAFRRSAISAPIAAVILAPCLLLIAGPFFLHLHHAFLVEAGHRGAWVIYVLVVVLILCVCALLAKVAALACRAVFEYLPPWMHNRLGFRHDLLVRTAIFLGGSLSLLVVLAFFGWLAIGLRNYWQWEICSGVIGLAAAAACVRALFRLRTPEAFQPAPLSDSVKRMIFRES